MNRKLLVILTFALLWFIGCASEKQTTTSRNVEGYQSTSSKPAWIMSGKYPSYPEPRYVVGVGLSKATGDPVADRRAADQSAISEVLQQITANVSSDITFEKTEIIGDKVQISLERTVANSRVRTSLTISGLKIEERYYDPEAKLFYSLAVLDRVEASAPIYSSLRQESIGFRTCLTASESNSKLGRIEQSLVGLKAALRSAAGFKDILPQFRILATPDMLADSLIANPPSATVILNRMTDYLSRVKLSVVAGGKQKYILGKPLQVPLTVRVTIDSGEAVAGLPVSFRFESGRGEVTSQGMTDSAGIASAIVENVDRANVPVYTIAAEIGFQHLADTANYAAQWNNGLSNGNRKVLFQFQRKLAPRPLKVLILLSESRASSASMIAQSVMSQEFSEVGFSPVTQSDIGVLDTKSVVKAVQQAQFESLRHRFPGKFDLIVVGEISASPLSDVEGMKIYVAKGSVKAFSVSNGVNLGADSFENVRGFGNSDEQASESAIRNGASDAAEKIIGDILSKY